MAVEYSPKGIRRIILPREIKDDILLQLDTKNTVIDNSQQASVSDLIRRIQAYLSGDPVYFKDKLDIDRATLFQRRVWRATQAIHYGQTRSYGWLAEQHRSLPSQQNLWHSSLPRHPSQSIGSERRLHCYQHWPLLQRPIHLLQHHTHRLNGSHFQHPLY